MHDDDRCCCGNLSVQRGSQIFGVLSVLYVLANVIATITSHLGSGAVAGSAALCGVVLICVVLMFIGIHHERGNLLLPYIVIEVVEVVLNVGALIIAIVAIAKAESIIDNYNDDHPDDTISVGTLRTAGAILIVVAIIRFFFLAWVLRTVLRCRRVLLCSNCHHGHC